MLYGDWISRWGNSFPDAEALVDVSRNRRYTYRELRDDVHRMANFLLSLGIGKGDRVAVLSLNRAEYIILFFAVSRIGAILVPLNHRLAPGEFTYYLEDSAPQALFFDRKHFAPVAGFKLKAGVPYTICFDEAGNNAQSLESLWRKLSACRPDEVALGPDDPQLIIYTSGTTGLPKGVILTHGMMTWNSINTNLGWGLRRGERTILHSPLFYTAGWNVLTLPLFHTLGTNILIDRFDPDLVLELIEREHVTVFFAVPTNFQMMMESPKFDGADLSSVRFMVSGGAPLPERIFEAFNKKGVHLWEGYGLTEAGPNNFLANGKLNTVGHSMPHVDLKLVDADGKEVPAGQEGELLLRGPHVSPGYWNKPDATSEAFVDGWFRTGDVARIDADGHVSIVGRKRDMFISGGINIYPAEIENAVSSHPDVAAAAVIGVADEKWGEVGKAVIELKPGAHLNLGDLQAFLAEHFAKYKIPRYMVVVDSLPRTVATGKVQKFVLKEKHGNPDNK